MGRLTRMRLPEFVTDPNSKRWQLRMSSARSSFFVADITSRLSDDDIGTDGFGLEDVGATFARRDVEVTLFLSGNGSWVTGLLIATTSADLARGAWRAIPGWDGSNRRPCLDSGIGVIAAAESFESIHMIRGDATAFEVAQSVADSDTPIGLQDRVYFATDANCFDCWALGEAGEYAAVYVDLDTN